MVFSATFSPESQKIVSASYDKTMQVWSVASLATGNCEHTVTEHIREVTSAAFSPDGLKVVSASYDERVRVWNTATGVCDQSMDGHTGPVTSAAFSPTTG